MRNLRISFAVIFPSFSRAMCLKALYGSKLLSEASTCLCRSMLRSPFEIVTRRRLSRS